MLNTPSSGARCGAEAEVARATQPPITCQLARNTNDSVIPRITSQRQIHAAEVIPTHGQHLIVQHTSDPNNRIDPPDPTQTRRESERVIGGCR